MIWFIKLLVLITIATSIIFLVFNPDLNDLGLKFFRKIKDVKGESVNLIDIESVNGANVYHTTWDMLLSRHVDEKGMVNYLGFREDITEFNLYLDSLSFFPPPIIDRTEESLAYWINAYNAFTVKLILDHYPVTSIKEIGGNVTMINSPWDIKFFKIGGVDFDLNTIEHVILRDIFLEERIHFAINCASISCPVLRGEAYRGEKIEAQLEEQASIFINDRDRNIIDGSKVRLSRIFDWFNVDFTRKGDLIEYLNRYSSIPIDTNAEIEYLVYDWNLNIQSHQ